jgi:hypothetical protein
MQLAALHEIQELLVTVPASHPTAVKSHFNKHLSKNKFSKMRFYISLFKHFHFNEYHCNQNISINAIKIHHASRKEYMKLIIIKLHLLDDYKNIKKNIHSHCGLIQKYHKQSASYKPIPNLNHNPTVPAMQCTLLSQNSIT